MSINDRLFCFEDKWNNRFHCKNGNITLQLKSESRIRNIGEIIIVNSLTIYKMIKELTKPEREIDIFRKTNSWSIPIEIFNKVDGIEFTTERFSYKVLTSKVKNDVNYFAFIKSGYEGKIYVPLNLWHKKTVN